jgi:hypothetical protein
MKRASTRLTVRMLRFIESDFNTVFLIALVASVGIGAALGNAP